MRPIETLDHLVAPMKKRPIFWIDSCAQVELERPASSRVRILCARLSLDVSRKANRTQSRLSSNFYHFLKLPHVVSITNMHTKSIWPGYLTIKMFYFTSFPWNTDIHTGTHDCPPPYQELKSIQSFLSYVDMWVSYSFATTFYSLLALACIWDPGWYVIQFSFHFFSAVQQFCSLHIILISSECNIDVRQSILMLLGSLSCDRARYTSFAISGHTCKVVL